MKAVPQGADSRPVVLYQGSIDDGAYNAVVHAGVEHFRTMAGAPCEEQQVPMLPGVYDRAVRHLAEQGYSPIIIPYGNAVLSMEEIAREYSGVRFVLLDGLFDMPNVYCFTFDEHEGAFLAGALAAMASTTEIIGVIGGKNSPVVNRCMCGFKQGARYVRPAIRVMENYIGTQDLAWRDTDAAAILARQQLAAGADVIFQVAGVAGLAVIREVHDAGKLSIGIDANQNGLAPGSVLTSMLKRVDKAVFAALMLARRGGWRENVKHLGVSQQVVGLAFDQNNAELITPAMRHDIGLIIEQIQMGIIRVHDYTENNFCPVW